MHTCDLCRPRVTYDTFDELRSHFLDVHKKEPELVADIPATPVNLNFGGIAR